MSVSAPESAAAAELLRLRQELAAAQATAAQAQARAAYYQQLFEQPGQAALVVRAEACVAGNAAALPALGLTAPGQIPGRPLTHLTMPVQPDGQTLAEWLPDALEQARQHGQLPFTWLLQPPGRAAYWLRGLLSRLHLPDGEAFHLTWTPSPATPGAPDFPDHPDPLALALEATAAGVWVCTLPTRTAYLDERTRALVGVPEALLPYSQLLAQIPADDLAHLRAVFQQAQQHRQPFDAEFRLHHPTRGLRHLLAMGRVEYDRHQQPFRLTGLLRDVTDRHQVHHELHRTNALLEQMLQHLPLVLGRFDRAGQLLELTGAGLRHLHVADNEGVGRPAGYLMQNMQEPIARVLAGESVSFVARGEAQGQPVYLQCLGFFDQMQQCGVIFSMNITELELGKQQLQAEKEFTEHLLNHSLDAIVACNQQGQVTAWNQVMERLTGVPAAAVLARPLAALPAFTPDTAVGQALHQLLAGHAAPYHHVPFLCHTRECEANLLPLPVGPEPGAGVLVVIRDVTQRNQLLAETTSLHLQRQQEILAAVLEAQETERRRIAEGLHNGVGQLLYAAKLSLPPTPEAQATRAVLEEAIRATRTISFELTPGVLVDFGLQTALEELVKRIPRQHLAVRLHLAGLPPRLASPVEMALYRIAQELLNNIIRHAQATQATLSLTYQADTLTLLAEDNGVGFPAHLSPAQPLPGVGLTSIRHRAELLHGSFTLESAAGQGTRARVTLPYPPEPPATPA